MRPPGMANEAQAATETLSWRSLPDSLLFPLRGSVAVFLLGRDKDARALLEQARERCDDPELLQRIDAASKALAPAN